MDIILIIVFILLGVAFLTLLVVLLLWYLNRLPWCPRHPDTRDQENTPLRTPSQTSSLEDEERKQELTEIGQMEEGRKIQEENKNKIQGENKEQHYQVDSSNKENTVNKEHLINKVIHEREGNNVIASSIPASPQDLPPNPSPDTQAPLLCRMPPCPPAMSTIQTFILERIRSSLEEKGHTLEVRLLTWYKL